MESNRSTVQLATQIRREIISMLSTAGSGHPAGALGMADVFAVLYGSVLHHRPAEPDWADRDRVLLSNGHICPALYASLALTGYFPVAELASLRKWGSRLQGHPHRGSLPGVEITSGPLGQGLSQACGLAVALRLQSSNSRVYCLMSDGEHDEGQTWEAYLFGAKEKLSNLIVLIDRNHIQIDGPTEKVLPMQPLSDKLRAFNWQVLEIDGHDHGAIESAIETSHLATDQPTAIICTTVPGKGVSFMEGNYEWHGKPPSTVEAKLALSELESQGT